jgi:disulfide oxidoreductase YuzD
METMQVATSKGWMCPTCTISNRAVLGGDSVCIACIAPASREVLEWLCFKVNPETRKLERLYPENPAECTVFPEHEEIEYIKEYYWVNLVKNLLSNAKVEIPPEIPKCCLQYC